MNHNTKLAVLKAGIVPGTSVDELARWGMEVPESLPPEKDRRIALSNIRESVEALETVTIRITDLDALKEYQQNAQEGRLYYSSAKKTAFVDVTFYRTTIGNYVIPWTSEDIYDLMLDENTYLKPMGGERVYFSDVSELYYGEQKAFIVCRPAVEGP